eukprot:gene8924-6260_t
MRRVKQSHPEGEDQGGIRALQPPVSGAHASSITSLEEMETGVVFEAAGGEKDQESIVPLLSLGTSPASEATSTPRVLADEEEDAAPGISVATPDRRRSLPGGSIGNSTEQKKTEGRQSEMPPYVPLASSREAPLSFSMGGSNGGGGGRSGSSYAELRRKRAQQSNYYKGSGGFANLAVHPTSPFGIPGGTGASEGSLFTFPGLYNVSNSFSLADFAYTTSPVRSPRGGPGGGDGAVSDFAPLIEPTTAGVKGSGGGAGGPVEPIDVADRSVSFQTLAELSMSLGTTVREAVYPGIRELFPRLPEDFIIGKDRVVIGMNGEGGEVCGEDLDHRLLGEGQFGPVYEARLYPPAAAPTPLAAPSGGFGGFVGSVTPPPPPTHQRSSPAPSGAGAAFHNTSSSSPPALLAMNNSNTHAGSQWSRSSFGLGPGSAAGAVCSNNALGCYGPPPPPPPSVAQTGEGGGPVPSWSAGYSPTLHTAPVPPPPFALHPHSRLQQTYQQGAMATTAPYSRSIYQQPLNFRNRVFYHSGLTHTVSLPTTLILSGGALPPTAVTLVASSNRGGFGGGGLPPVLYDTTTTTSRSDERTPSPSAGYVPSRDGGATLDDALSMNLWMASAGVEDAGGATSRGASVGPALRPSATGGRGRHRHPPHRSSSSPGARQSPYPTASERESGKRIVGSSSASCSSKSPTGAGRMKDEKANKTALESHQQRQWAPQRVVDPLTPLPPPLCTTTGVGAGEEGGDGCSDPNALSPSTTIFSYPPLRRGEEEEEEPCRRWSPPTAIVDAGATSTPVGAGGDEEMPASGENGVPPFSPNSPSMKETSESTWAREGEDEGALGDVVVSPPLSPPSLDNSKKRDEHRKRDQKSHTKGETEKGRNAAAETQEGTSSRDRAAQDKGGGYSCTCSSTRWPSTGGLEWSRDGHAKALGTPPSPPLPQPPLPPHLVPATDSTYTNLPHDEFDMLASSPMSFLSQHTHLPPTARHYSPAVPPQLHPIPTTATTTACSRVLPQELSVPLPDHAHQKNPNEHPEEHLKWHGDGAPTGETPEGIAHSSSLHRHGDGGESGTESRLWRTVTGVEEEEEHEPDPHRTSLGDTARTRVTSGSGTRGKERGGRRTPADTEAHRSGSQEMVCGIRRWGCHPPQTRRPAQVLQATPNPKAGSSQNNKSSTTSSALLGTHLHAPQPSASLHASSSGSSITQQVTLNGGDCVLSLADLHLPAGGDGHGNTHPPSSYADGSLDETSGGGQGGTTALAVADVFRCALLGSRSKQLLEKRLLDATAAPQALSGSHPAPAPPPFSISSASSPLTARPTPTPLLLQTPAAVGAGPQPQWTPPRSAQTPYSPVEYGRTLHQCSGGGVFGPPVAPLYGRPTCHSPSIAMEVDTDAASTIGASSPCMMRPTSCTTAAFHTVPTMPHTAANSTSTCRAGAPPHQSPQSSSTPHHHHLLQRQQLFPQPLHGGPNHNTGGPIHSNLVSPVQLGASGCSRSFPLSCPYDDEEDDEGGAAGAGFRTNMRRSYGPYHHIPSGGGVLEDNSSFLATTAAASTGTLPINYFPPQPQPHLQPGKLAPPLLHGRGLTAADASLGDGSCYCNSDMPSSVLLLQASTKLPFSPTNQYQPNNNNSSSASNPYPSKRGALHWSPAGGLGATTNKQLDRWQCDSFPMHLPVAETAPGFQAVFDSPISIDEVQDMAPAESKAHPPPPHPPTHSTSEPLARPPQQPVKELAALRGESDNALLQLPQSGNAEIVPPFLQDSPDSDATEASSCEHRRSTCVSLCTPPAAWASGRRPGHYEAGLERFGPAGTMTTTTNNYTGCWTAGTGVTPTASNAAAAGGSLLRSCGCVPYRRVAVKVFAKMDLDDYKRAGALRREVLMGSRLQHPLLVHWLGVAEDMSDLFLIMDVIPNGTLEKMLKELRTTPEERWRRAPRVMADIVLILEYLQDGTQHAYEEVPPPPPVALPRGCSSSEQLPLHLDEEVGAAPSGSGYSPSPTTTAPLAYHPPLHRAPWRDKRRCSPSTFPPADTTPPPVPPLPPHVGSSAPPAGSSSASSPGDAAASQPLPKPNEEETRRRQQEQANLQGIVLHRDLKPSNFMLSQDGHLRLGDFGSACFFGDSEGNTYDGTFAYMSTEMITSGKAGRYSDLWSAGCILYEMLEGATPFKGQTGYLITVQIKRFQPGTLQFPAVTRFLSSLPASSSGDDGDKLRSIRKVLEAGMELATALLQPDPTQRLGAAEQGGFEALKRHAFFDGVDWEHIHDTDNYALWSEMRSRGAAGGADAVQRPAGPLEQENAALNGMEEAVPVSSLWPLPDISSLLHTKRNNTTSNPSGVSDERNGSEPMPDGGGRGSSAGSRTTALLQPGEKVQFYSLVVVVEDPRFPSTPLVVLLTSYPRLLFVDWPSKELLYVVMLETEGGGEAGPEPATAPGRRQERVGDHSNRGRGSTRCHSQLLPATAADRAEEVERSSFDPDETNESEEPPAFSLSTTATTTSIVTPSAAAAALPCRSRRRHSGAADTPTGEDEEEDEASSVSFFSPHGATGQGPAWGPHSTPLRATVRAEAAGAGVVVFQCRGGPLARSPGKAGAATTAASTMASFGCCCCSRPPSPAADGGAEGGGKCTVLCGCGCSCSVTDVLRCRDVCGQAPLWGPLLAQVQLPSRDTSKKKTLR